ncbi:MurR/RpiR family transcriptional regulator [Psychrobacillus vulpis]|uniref:MurR/RpiR family transcriptional regulator n=1 Tax=Psychrobacillus vulpis TaxID=2325572 RepID=A0A544TV56_9BACI|nr:MurR/RpiR family transcriptional regulator [Psychrobacillus vulpis]TQR21326.1 MurR/RpiR family transcriptional regulator [Psychrobacillus vulpis]
MILHELIRENFVAMSKSQKKMANYVIDHPKDIAMCSASELGSKIGISESTVIRFSYTLGFSGYVELQKLIREHFFSHESSITTYQQSKLVLPNNTSFFKQVMEQDRQSIQHTMNQIQEDQYHEAIERLSKANSVYILGLRSSYSAANWLSFSLGLVKDNVHFIRPETEDVIRTISKMDTHSVVIIISFHRYLKETIQIAELAQRQKAFVIGITDSLLAPIHIHSNVIFPIFSPNKSTLDAVSPLFSFMNAIVAGLIVEQKEDFMKRQELYKSIPSNFLFDEEGEAT